MVVNKKAYKRPEMVVQETPRGRTNGCRLWGRMQGGMLSHEAKTRETDDLNYAGGRIRANCVVLHTGALHYCA